MHSKYSSVIALLAAFAFVLFPSCEKPETVVAVESVALNKTDLTLEVGTSATLTVTILPDNAADKAVSWSSSNDAVATVSETGTVTAIAEGRAVITAKVGQKSASCTVTVPHVVIPVESITLDNTEITLEVGSKTTLKATVSPAGADNPEVTWTTSDASIATVTQDGVVEAIAEGTATITAKAGEKTATCVVTVPHVFVPVEGIALNQNELTLEVGNTFTLVATVEPSNADEPAVTWTSSDPAVATVTQSGEVEAIAEGTATITAQAGDKTATCAVTVNPVPPVNPESISLNKTDLTLGVGASFALVATILPDDATDKTVTWKSSDETVATVVNGTVTAIAAGTATITATTANGIEATCQLTVIVPTDGSIEGVIIIDSEFNW